MAHPKQNTQVIVKQLPNVAPFSIDSQLEQAKAAFSAARDQLANPAKKYLIPPSLAERFSLLEPRPRTSVLISLRNTDSDQVCRLQRCINHWKTSEALA